ncbi:MAG TPA: thioesterase family protein [Solirubrobacteraceae bacterium]|nr:thioesterase family protein [Solirubrobacteraceae bacterium]
MNVTLDPRLTGFGGAAHGGYVMTLALRAMAAAVDDPERTPRSLTMHLLAPIGPGDVEIDARLERAGGSMSSASARVAQGGATVATALAAFGRARPSLAQQDATMPDVPSPDELAPLVDVPVPESEMDVERRPARGPLPLTGGDRPELAAWMRMASDEPVDVYRATHLADALAPALYGALDEYVAMPSTEIALHYAPDTRSDSPWVLAVVRNRFAGDGYALEDGELWTPDGRLLLRSRQMRRILG